jgi:hypothetical protein
MPPGPTGLCTTMPAAIPIAPLHLQAARAAKEVVLSLVNGRVLRLGWVDVHAADEILHGPRRRRRGQRWKRYRVILWRRFLLSVAQLRGSGRAIPSRCRRRRRSADGRHLVRAADTLYILRRKTYVGAGGAFANREHRRHECGCGPAIASLLLVGPPARGASPRFSRPRLRGKLPRMKHTEKRSLL